MVFITAIRMSGGNGHEHISDVTWKNPSTGKTGQNSRAEMVRWIKVEHGEAKVTDGRSTIEVGVVEASTPYLRTHADGKWTDNLLALPRF